MKIEFVLQPHFFVLQPHRRTYRDKYPINWDLSG